MTKILVYHKVSEGREFGLSCVRPSVFVDHMSFLHDRGFRAVPVSELDTSVAAGRTMSLMFDDAYEDVYHHAATVLDNLGFVATVGVITGFVGGLNAWDTSIGTSFRHMTWEHIRTLVKMGWEVASHTCSHRSLVRLSAEQASLEIRHSKDVLEDHLGIRIRHFVYPYGRSNPAIADMVAVAGYESASGFFGHGRFDMPRRAVYYGDSADTVYAKVCKNNANDFMARVVNACSYLATARQYLGRRNV